MSALTLDQIQLFLTVVDQGSFSKAALALNRAQSAVTYGVQKLEAQIGLSLFDRGGYRPVLTEAGRALLLRARRIVDEADGFRDAARSLAGGLEAELTLVVDAMFPMSAVLDPLRAFTAQFPTVPPRLYVQSMGAGVEMVQDGTCMIGLTPLVFGDIARFRRFPLLTIDLVPVVAADHPLALIEGPLEAHLLHQHVQLVLTDRSRMTEGREFGVLSGRTWRLADLGAKHAMLLAGLGWGNMPAHMVADDIARGRLKVIAPAQFDPRTAQVVMGGLYSAERQLGPAGRWMIEHLSGLTG